MEPTPRLRIAIALVALPLAAVLVSCGGGGEADSPTAGAVDAGSAPVAREPSGDGGGARAVDTVEAGPEVIERSVIATGALRVSTSRLDDARRDAIDLVAGLRGHVADEDSQSDSRGRTDRVDLTLRVPAASFAEALDGIGRLGTVRHREQSVEDVTTQVIDNAARVRAQQASVASIERLLARATTIGEIMSIERQLSSRQAELDSLEQQQKWLADQTSLSTIRLSLTRPTRDRDVDHAGFLGGLESGWNALGASASAVSTAAGAVLPFAALAGLVALPVWVVLRRRRTVVTPEA